MIRADAVVVGLGAMGAATIYQLAKLGVKVVGIDAHHPPHTFGSTHGETRITRQAIGEGEQFVPLVLRAHQIWREIEAETGARLLNECGGLIMARTSCGNSLHGRADFLGTTFHTARTFGILHESLNASEMAYRFPQFVLQGDDLGYFEPGAGYLDPEACVRAQLQLAVQHGARVLTGRRASWRAAGPHEGDGAVVDTGDEQIRASTIVLAGGAWLPQLAPLLKPKLSVRRQVLHWFALDGTVEYSPGRFPVFIYSWGADDAEAYYGFPSLGATVGSEVACIKVAAEQRTQQTDPDAIQAAATEDEVADMYTRHVHGRMRGITERSVRTATCFYTSTADANFIIDRLPDSPQVIVVSACSGHGFKHSAAIGEAVAEMVRDGATPARLLPFALRGVAS
jgi:sarcosine oxidase